MDTKIAIARALITRPLTALEIASSLENLPKSQINSILYNSSEFRKIKGTQFWTITEGSEFFESGLESEVLKALAHLAIPVKAAQLAAHIGANRSSVNRTLYALLKEGKVIKNPQHPIWQLHTA